MTLNATWERCEVSKSQSREMSLEAPAFRWEVVVVFTRGSSGSDDNRFGMYFHDRAKRTY
jgi:hypothetical protein